MNEIDPTPHLALHLVNGDHFSQVGIRSILQTDPAVTFTALKGSLSENITQMAQDQPDIVLFDVKDDLDRSRDPLQKILEKRLPTKLVVIANEFDPLMRDWSGDFGISGFFIKHAIDHNFAASLRKIRSGYDLFILPETPRSTRRVSRRLESKNYLKSLDETSQALVKMVALGQSNNQIATNLHLSEGTVKLYLGRILAALDLKSRVQLAVVATECRIVSSVDLDRISQ